MIHPPRAALAALLLVAGSTSTAVDGSDRSSAPVTGGPRPPGPIPGAAVRLISATGVGGRGSLAASPLNSERQVRAFLRRFPNAALRGRIHRAVEARLGVPDRDVVGAVVAIGCDRPPGADVSADQDGHVLIVARKVANPHPECFAAVTTVAIAVLPRR